MGKIKRIVWQLERFLENQCRLEGVAIEDVYEVLLEKATPEPILQDILDSQETLDRRIRDQRGVVWATDSDEINDLCTAMVQEVEELRRLTNWKRWKDDGDLDLDKARVKLIDIFHFWASTANRLGMTAKDIRDVYFEKNEINHRRQEEGY